MRITLEFSGVVEVASRMNAQKSHEDLVELLVSFGRSLVHQESRRRFPNGTLEMAVMS